MEENKVHIYCKMYEPSLKNDISKFVYKIWEPKTKCWVVKVLSIDDNERLKHIIKKYNLYENSSVTKYLLEKYEEFHQFKNRKKELIKMSNKVSLEFDDDIPKYPKDRDYFPFQKVAIRYLEKNDGRSLIADQMGLGKTVMCLGYVYNNPQKSPVLIVCPASVKYQWQNESLIWTRTKKKEILLINGRKNKIPKGYRFYIINYDILYHNLLELMKIPFKLMILDECHRIKQIKSKCSQASLTLSKEIESVICLTGTPIQNRPVDIFTSLRAIGVEDPKLKNWEAFTQRYCNAHDNGFGMDYTGSSHEDELNVKLRESVMIRRLKKDVFKQLPEKRRMIVHIPLDDETFYKSHFDIFKEELIMGEYTKYDEVLLQIEKLKQMAVSQKYKSMLDWIKNTLNNNEKVLIFAHHKLLQEKLCNDLQEFNVLHLPGGISAKKKQTLIDNFNKNPDIKVAVASLIAYSEGVNLQHSCSTAIFTELWWNPSTHEQAEARVHRIGQTEQVDIYYLIADNSIETYIWDMIDRKQKIIEKSIDGIGKEEVPKGFISELVKDLESSFI